MKTFAQAKKMIDELWTEYRDEADSFDEIYDKMSALDILKDFLLSCELHD